MTEFNFDKRYKLCSRKLIDEVYTNGQLIKSYPFVVRVKGTKLPDNSTFQIVISAPKRSFRKAYQRNRIRRMCKEAIRTNKNIIESFLAETNQQLALFLIFTGKEEIPLEVLNKKTEKLFHSIVKQLSLHEK